MFSKKKTECRVCGYRFTPERENIYTAEEPRSALEILTAAPTRFSAVDCPICGCQIALAIRVPRVDLSDNAERHDADARGGIRLFYLSQRGQTQHIFTITFTGKRKSASCAGGYGSRTTTGTPPIPRPSLQW